MKKIVSIGLCLCMAVLTFANNAPVGRQGAGDPRHADIHPRAIRNFSKAYKHSQDPEWSITKEGGFVGRFTEDLIPHRAYYDARGNWLYTISGFGGDKLPRDLWALVRSTYYDYTISYVNQIDLPMGRKVFLIQAQDAKNVKVIRIGDDEMDTIQEIEKL